MSDLIDVPKTPEDFECSHCGDEHYVLIRCCAGGDCGCYGLPVDIAPCNYCNEDEKKEMGAYVAEWAISMWGEQ